MLYGVLRILNHDIFRILKIYHNSYNVNNFINESINYLYQEKNVTLKVRRTTL